MAGWVPRGVDPATRELLVDGVPVWMKPALLEWLKPHLARSSRALPGTWFFEADKLMKYDLVARLSPSYVSRVGDSTWPGFVARLPDEELLDLVDWAVHDQTFVPSNNLEDILESGGSAWTVGKRNGNNGLVRRMPESVQTAVETTLQQGAAGRLLGEAWAAAFGRRADPEQAYEMSIKAVEEAVAPLVAPKSARATLGTIIRDMKAQGDWRVDLPGRDADVIVAMASALWTGQESRHGGAGYRKPSQREAETAVTLAVAIVQLATSGSIARRPRNGEEVLES